MTAHARLEDAVAEPFADVSVRWFLRVRAFAVATELAVTLLVLLDTGEGGRWLLSPLPVLAATAWLTARTRTRPPSAPVLLGHVLLDVTCLSLWLTFTGGPANPWSALYLVYVALSALMLPPRGTVLVVAAAALAYGGTFLSGADPHAGHGDASDRHLEGMYVAYVVSSALVAYFVSRVRQALHARELDLLAARERVARASKVAAMTTLAAGAAHELGSPLATIAVVAKELERALAAQGAGESLVDDARLVRAEVDRCRGVLERLAERAGGGLGASAERVSLAQLVEEVARDVGPRFGRVERTLSPPDGEATVARRAVVSVATNLVGNALDACADGQRVELRVEASPSGLVLVVRDEGPGMSADTAARAFDAFFTTKAPGEGMGLGLFLVATTVEALGGTVDVRSAPGEGTTVTVRVPSSPSA